MNKDFTMKVAPISFDEAISIIHGYAERVFIEAVQCEDKQAKAVLCSKFAALSKAQTALEKQKPQKPIHNETNNGKHKWKLDDKGEVDEFAWDCDYHSGVVCERCGIQVCTMCEPDYDDLVFI